SLVGISVMDPTLVAERLHPGPGGQDYPLTIAMLLLGIDQYVVAGLDVGRFHWSDTVAPRAQAIALLVVGAALAVETWAVAVNRFFSSVIRLQTDRGHHVITSGPYRYVRHPGYAAMPFLLVGTGVVLGSWLAAAIGGLLSAGILRRTAREDR